MALLTIIVAWIVGYNFEKLSAGTYAAYAGNDPQELPGYVGTRGQMAMVKHIAFSPGRYRRFITWLRRGVVWFAIIVGIGFWVQHYLQNGRGTHICVH